jgi:hypothetical protein
VKKAIFLTWLIIVFSTTGLASALRCGSGLVDEGDQYFEVLKTCGAPISKEIIGYTLTRDGKRELKMEHWVYGPWDGYYYILIFEGGILKKITDFRGP